MPPTNAGFYVYSAQVGAQGLSNDRLVNATNTNLRSYMTVNRPGQSSGGKSERPRSGWLLMSPFDNSHPYDNSCESYQHKLEVLLDRQPTGGVRATTIRWVVHGTQQFIELYHGIVYNFWKKMT